MGSCKGWGELCTKDAQENKKWGKPHTRDAPGGPHCNPLLAAVSPRQGCSSALHHHPPAPPCSAGPCTSQRTPGTSTCGGIEGMIRGCCSQGTPTVLGERGLPGGVTSSTDPDGFQHSTSSQLLHCSPGVKAGAEMKGLSHSGISWGCTYGAQGMQVGEMAQLHEPPAPQHSHEGQLAVVGFDAAHVVWCGAAQRLHQPVQGGFEL